MINQREIINSVVSIFLLHVFSLNGCFNEQEHWSSAVLLCVKHQQMLLPEPFMQSVSQVGGEVKVSSLMWECSRRSELTQF